MFQVAQHGGEGHLQHLADVKLDIWDGVFCFFQKRGQQNLRQLILSNNINELCKRLQKIMRRQLHEQSACEPFQPDGTAILVHPCDRLGDHRRQLTMQH